ncbi:type VII secretion-associated serine protease mycosin [Kibdelosporangium philippinense]|uniref:Type VII secretion-associated serine protease mycosin n=1 Tax=Kibdelosporangium philippinense TaxID=211113 RepID=A0ABS8ZD54_9PSEU|nr:type VII secretion-associated serine protease mycosin [Kibdelosporangium philippinense]MCE7005775.1 type VII secretion-associated serine protease mycosin [Kibdelosporangium philippinense]
MTTTPTKIATVIAVAGLLMSNPGYAQQQPKPLYASGPVPPKVDMSRALITDTKGPPQNVDYAPKGQCMSSLNDGNVVLPNKPWGQQQLRIEEAQKFATGKGQVVAVIDTGVREHDYLKGRVLKGADYVSKNSNSLDDCDGHGTEVAGIIAAKSPDLTKVGFTGVAPDAKILAIRQSSEIYKGTPAPTPEKPNPSEETAGNLTTLAQAVVHAANIDEVTVINMSVDNCRSAEFAMNGPEKDLQRALRYAVDQNKVVVASAGNQGPICKDPRNGPDPKNPTHIVTPPWFAEDVISVAAVNRKGNLAPFSVQGPWVSVAAPGTEIISLDPGGTLANQTYQGQQRTAIQGTSFAAPYVAGLAALIRERFPDLKARDVMHRIKMTAQHPAAPGGRDNLVGYGMINPIAALTAMVPAEFNIPNDTAENLPASMPPIKPKDWTAMTVALIGAGGGVLLLLLTLFVMHAIRRNKPES